MAGFFQNLATVNQTLRTAGVLTVTAVVGYGGYLGYDRYVRPGVELESVKDELNKLTSELEASRETAGRLRQQVGQLEKDNDRLSTSLKLIKVDSRLAYLTVTDAEKNPETGKSQMKVLFTEVGPDGKPVGPQRVFTLNGTLLSVDCWIAKFDDKYIEQADLVRGGSLCIIRGIRGDGDTQLQAIDEGTPYQDPNADPQPAVDPRPLVYRSLGESSELEKKIWSDFWSVANDLNMQKELGIRAAHGQVNYIQIQPGTTYRLDLRASDGGTIKPEENPPAFALPNPPGA